MDCGFVQIRASLPDSLRQRLVLIRTRLALAPVGHSGYIAGMKTAVSIPDDIFERAERLASQKGRSRSQVYAAALDEYLARHVHDEVTDAMNRVCDDVGGDSDPFLAAAGRRVLNRVEW